MSENIPKPFQKYRHFKGNVYQVLCIAKNSETLEEMVVYQALYGDFEIFVRPLKMFLSKVDRDKYPDAAQIFRFERIEDEKAIPDSGETDNRESDAAESDYTGTNVTKPDSDQIIEDFNKVLDADVERFLDADSYEERLEILSEIGERADNDMIDIMSTVLDIEIPEGPAQKRFEKFKDALMTRRHYEARRLR